MLRRDRHVSLQQRLNVYITLISPINKILLNVHVIGSRSA